jgi:hypothetical protein
VPSFENRSPKVPKTTHDGLFKTAEVLQIPAAKSGEALIELRNELDEIATLQFCPDVQ